MSISSLRDILHRHRKVLGAFAIIVVFVSTATVIFWHTYQAPEADYETKFEIVKVTETFADLNMTNMGRAHIHIATILNATIEWNATDRVMVYASWHANEYCYDFSHGTVDGEWVYGGFLFRQVGMKGTMYLGPDYFDLTDGQFWSFGWNSQYLYGGERYYSGRVNMTYTVTLFMRRAV